MYFCTILNSLFRNDFLESGYKILVGYQITVISQRRIKIRISFRAAKVGKEDGPPKHWLLKPNLSKI